jgi:hypothetical protein
MIFHITWSQPYAFCSTEAIKCHSYIRVRTGEGIDSSYAYGSQSASSRTWLLVQAGCRSSFPHDPNCQKEFRYYKTLKPLEKFEIMCLICHLIGSSLFWIWFEFKRLTLVPKINNLCYQKHLHIDGILWYIYCRTEFMNAT